MLRLVEKDGRTPVRAQVLDEDGNLWPGTLVMRPGGMITFLGDSPDSAVRAAEAPYTTGVKGQRNSAGQLIDGLGRPIEQAPVGDGLVTVPNGNGEQQLLAGDVPVAAATEPAAEPAAESPAGKRPAGKRPAGQRA